MVKMRIIGAFASIFFVTSGVSPVFAKQCIWNKAGFILNINWINNNNVIRKDRILLGQGNCSTGDVKYTVVLSIQDGKMASDFTKGFINAAAGALGIAAPEAAGGAAAMAALSSKIPDAQEIFYTGVPGSDRYLDVWGTVWNPQTGPGGPIH